MQQLNIHHNDEAGVSTGLFRFNVSAEQQGQRLDRVLADAAEAAGLSLSRTRLQALIAEGQVLIDGVVVRSAKVKLVAATLVSVTIPEAKPAEPEGQPIPLDVVYEDEHLLVLDKPVGLVVHPSAGHADGTLVNALIAHCGDSLSGIGGVKRPGIVHRLDKDTSGLMVVAKTDAAHEGLSAIFADHGRSGSLIREYRAFVWGVPDRGSGTIEAALARDPHNRLKIAVVPRGRGRSAVTHWQREEIFGTCASLIRCRLETGRTHQIRVHLAMSGHPLIGDDVYGAGFRTKAARLPKQAREIALALHRQALHAESLGFRHPVTGESLLLHAALPADLATLHTVLRSCFD